VTIKWALVKVDIGRKSGPAEPQDIITDLNDPSVITSTGEIDIPAGQRHGTISIWARGDNIPRSTVGPATKEEATEIVAIRIVDVIEGTGSMGVNIRPDPSTRLFHIIDDDPPITEGDEVNNVLLGDDVFVFSEGRGKDRVVDFVRGSDLVQLDVSIGNNHIDSFDELQLLVASGDIALRTGPDNLSLTFDNGDKLKLAGVTDLIAGDWLFA
jgi:hypothetical protein